jgi:hypothetical protein
MRGVGEGCPGQRLRVWSAEWKFHGLIFGTRCSEAANAVDGLTRDGHGLHALCLRSTGIRAVDDGRVSVFS